MWTPWDREGQHDRGGDSIYTVDVGGSNPSSPTSKPFRGKHLRHPSPRGSALPGSRPPSCPPSIRGGFVLLRHAMSRPGGQLASARLTLSLPLTLDSRQQTCTQPPRTTGELAGMSSITIANAGGIHGNPIASKPRARTVRTGEKIGTPDNACPQTTHHVPVGARLAPPRPLPSLRIRPGSRDGQSSQFSQPKPKGEQCPWNRS